jgi:hypothetical protein
MTVNSGTERVIGAIRTDTNIVNILHAVSTDNFDYALAIFDELSCFAGGSINRFCPFTILSGVVAQDTAVITTIARLTCTLTSHTSPCTTTGVYSRNITT